MVNYDLCEVLADHSDLNLLSEARTIVWAPLSHISLTSAFRDEGEDTDESENAESAMTFCAWDRGIRSSSRNDFFQETTMSLRLTSARRMRGCPS